MQSNNVLIGWSPWVWVRAALIILFSSGYKLSIYKLLFLRLLNTSVILFLVEGFKEVNDVRA